MCVCECVAGFLVIYGIPTIMDYLMPNPVYVWLFALFPLLCFYDIPTIMDYLMPNPVYTRIWNIICRHVQLITFLNESFLHKVFLSNMNNSIYYKSFIFYSVKYLYIICKRLVCHKFSFKTRTNLFAHEYRYCFYIVKQCQLLLSNTYNYIQY